VLLIVYNATAGVSVVQLYAGAFLPGFMLAFLYIGYIIALAKWKPNLMPPLPEEERRVPIPAKLQPLAARRGNALAALWRGVRGDSAGVPRRTVAGQLLISLLPGLPRRRCRRAPRVSSKRAAPSPRRRARPSSRAD
jgi:TRAP-type mannitol/chloroaromatic compound transport system permease large subunit